MSCVTDFLPPFNLIGRLRGILLISWTDSGSVVLSWQTTIKVRIVGNYNDLLRPGWANFVFNQACLVDSYIWKIELWQLTVLIIFLFFPLSKKRWEFGNNEVFFFLYISFPMCFILWEEVIKMIYGFGDTDCNFFFSLPLFFY